MTTTINRPEVLTRRPLVTPGATALGTLCLFRGPAPWIDATRRLSTPLWYGKTLLDQHGADAGAGFHDAGMLQRAIESEIGLCEHRPNVQHMREGVNWISLRDETPQERFTRRVPDPMCKLFPWESFDRDPFRDEALSSITTSVKMQPDRQQFWISPSLYDEVGGYFDLDDLPEAFTAGNGVTANTWRIINTGTQREVLLSLCVLDSAVVDRLGHDPQMWEAIRRIMESGETGAAYPTVPVAPEALVCEHEWQPITPDWPRIQGCVKCRGALKVGNSVTLNANSIALTIAAAPANPSAGTGVYYTAVDKQPLYLASDGTSTNMYGGGAAAVTKVGGNTVEATTTSSSLVDTQSVSVSIATGSVLTFVSFAIRKAVSAATCATSLKINTTQMVLVTTFTSAANEAQAGILCGNLYSFGANYDFSGALDITGGGVLLHNQVNQASLSNGTGMPNATITAVVCMEKNNDGTTTVGANRGEVFTYT